MKIELVQGDMSSGESYKTEPRSYRGRQKNLIPNKQGYTMSGFCIEIKFQAIKPISVKSPREVSTPTLKVGNEIRHWQVSLVGIGNLIWVVIP